MVSRNKKGEVTWDEIAKVVLALVALVILIYIVTQVIGGELGNQSNIVKDGFKNMG